MKEVIINGIQQMGIGVSDMSEAWKWYRKYFGVDIKVFEEAAEAKLMLPYTGGEPRSRMATLAINLQGGGGFEVWQYTSRTPKAPIDPIILGDLGLFAAKVKCKDAIQAYDFYKNNDLKLISKITNDGRGNPHFYLQDPYGNIFDIVQNDVWFKNEGKLTGGTFGATVGVSDMEISKEFYKNILGYDKVLVEEEGVLNDLKGLKNGNKPVHRVILAHSEERKAGFGLLFGTSEIELIKVVDYQPKKIFQNRFWGDLGFIHLCFDIVGMKGLREKCEKLGHPFTVDSFASLDASFDMGEAAGHFSYIEDPDGTWIEFVETHKIPILKKIGWYLDLRKKDRTKPLPKWLIRAMALNRVKDRS